MPCAQINIDTLNHARGTLLSHYTALSPSSRQSRFCGPVSEQGLRNFLEKPRQGIAFALSLDDEVIGICELVYTTCKRAEIGVSIIDKHQGQGFGQMLVQECLDYAQEKGLVEATFYFDQGNSSIRALLSSMNANITYDGRDGTATVALTPNTKKS